MTTRRCILGILAAMAVSGHVSHAAYAAELDKPKGEVILTVSGAVSNTNAGGKAQFDLDMLKAMPASSFTTTTTWTSGKVTFTGVSLKDLLAAVGSSGSSIRAVALNDYAVDIPATDAVPDGPIVAYMMDGKLMSVRDKGPLWVVYPYDSRADYRTEVIYSRSIWQLAAIEVAN